MTSFIGFVGPGDRPWTMDVERVRATVSQLGMSVVVETPSLLLFTSRDASLIRLPRSDGVVVGELLTREGEAVSTERLTREAPGGATADCLIQCFWGRYVAFVQEQGWTVLRDPSGGQPCYHASIGDVTCYFSHASLARAAGFCEVSFNWEMISTQLFFSTAWAKATCVSGVTELLPGYRSSVGSGLPEDNICWNPWHFARADKQIQSREEAVFRVHAEVMRSVKAWGAPASRVLLELSGGLDSSIVAAGLHHAGCDTVGCTLVSSDPGADERRYARAVCDHFGMPMITVPLTAEDADIPRLISLHSLRPPSHILSRVADRAFAEAGAREGVDAFFSGSGGDYVFGYLATSAPAADALLARGPGFTFLKAVSDLAELHQTTWWRAGRLAVRKALSASQGLRPRSTLLTEDARHAAEAWQPPEPTPSDKGWPGKTTQIESVLAGHEGQDAHGRGGVGPYRDPLLSQPMVELALRIPSWMNVAGGRNRSIAREAFREDLPSVILQRRTKAEFTRIGSEIFARNRSYIEDTVIDGRLVREGVVSRRAVEDGLRAADVAYGAQAVELITVACSEAWIQSWMQPHEVHPNDQTLRSFEDRSFACPKARN